MNQRQVDSVRVGRRTSSMSVKSPVIATERLILRPLVESDAPPIFENYATDPEVTRYLTWRPHKSIDETNAFVARQMAECNSGENHAWVITPLAEPAHVLGMTALRVKGAEADFGYVLGRKEWGKGYMTEALNGILKFASSIPTIRKVWAVCDVENKASARVMEKAGLTLEGVRARFIVHPNVSSEPRDVYCYYLDI